MSARTGDVTNIGGPKKHLGSQTGNSIWEPDRVEKLNGTKDNREKTIEDKAEIESLRKSMKAGRLDEMVEAIKATDTRTDSSILSKPSFAGSNFKKPQSGISIFDNGDFERIPEKTEGEKMAEEVRKAPEPDDSWKGIHKPKTANRAIDRIFDSLDSEDS